MSLEDEEAILEALTEGISDLDTDNSINKTDTRLRNLRELAEKLTEAAPRLLDQRRAEYDHVSVLAISWEAGEFQEMKRNAERITEIFATCYHYEVELFNIPESISDPEAELSDKLIQARRKLSKSDEQNLFIVYYCGHGVLGDEGQRLWQPKAKSSVSLDWSNAQVSLRGADCDVLFIFDCCFATGMVADKQRWRRRCEILGATNALDKARAEDHLSFTSMLYSELQAYGSQKGVAVDELHWNMTNQTKMEQHRLKKVPSYRRHYDMKTYPYGIFLRPMDKEHADENIAEDDTIRLLRFYNRSERLKSQTNAVMLIAANLTDTAERLNYIEWQSWVKVSPAAISSLQFRGTYGPLFPEPEANDLLAEVKLDAVYAGSCIAILRIPIWLWDCLEPSDSYAEIAVLRSDNLIRRKTRNADLLTASEPANVGGERPKSDELVSHKAFKDVTSSALKPSPAYEKLPSGLGLPTRDLFRERSVKNLRTARAAPTPKVSQLQHSPSQLPSSQHSQWQHSQSQQSQYILPPQHVPGLPTSELTPEPMERAPGKLVNLPDRIHGDLPSPKQQLATKRQELDRIPSLEREIREKNLLIGKLRHEAVVLSEHLTKALSFFKKEQPEDNVNRQLITNYLLNFLELPPGGSKKSEALQVIAALLNWSEDEIQRAGLPKQAPISEKRSQNAPLRPFRREPSKTALSTDHWADSLATEGSGKETLAELWSEFLDREAKGGP